MTPMAKNQAGEGMSIKLTSAPVHACRSDVGLTRPIAVASTQARAAGSGCVDTEGALNAGS